MAGWIYHKKEEEQKKVNLNSLVLIDEAHRLAPRVKQSDERVERIKSRLIYTAEPRENTY